MPKTSLGVLLGATLLAGWYSVSHFSVDGEMRDLIDQQTPWRADYERFKERFPSLQGTVVVVVSGDSMELVHENGKALFRTLSSNPDFQGVAGVRTDPFFDRHALYFLPMSSLDRLSDRLSASQPLLARVAEGRGIASVLELIEKALARQRVDEVAELIAPLAHAAETAAAGESGHIHWRDYILEGGDHDRQHYRLISVRPNPEREALRDRRVFLQTLQNAVADYEADEGVRVRLTGAVALAQEEIAAAREGVQVAGLVSLALLAFILYAGLRSLAVIASVLLMLAVGVTWTTAWGLLTVGSFNPLSLIFVVVFFGLGVDFAVHYALRYQEALPGTKMRALVDSSASVGNAILLCALSTSIGFLAFVWTDYQGLAELGIVAAGGMFIAAALTLTLLPPLLLLLPAPPKRQEPRLLSARLGRFVMERPRSILAVAGIGAILAVPLASQLSFDHSVLALKDPRAESMQVLRELQREGIANDYTVSVLVEDEAAIAATKQRLEALPEVASVHGPKDIVPERQDEKHALLKELRSLLWSALNPNRKHAPPDAEQTRQIVDQLIAELREHAEEETPQAETIGRFAEALQTLRADEQGRLLQWIRASTQELEEELRWLRTTLDAEPFTFGDLPTAARARVRGEGPTWRLVALPTEDVGDIAQLERYVKAVRTVAPEATGRPIIELELGHIVRTSFMQAIATAFLAVAYILLIALRSLRDTLITLAPLALAALLTAAFQSAIGATLNMANILVTPLIFGLGVDSGIHVMKRFRDDGSLAELTRSSTPRAIVISTLTTIGTFSALALSPHAGTASIGQLLSIAMVALLLSTLLVMPALLAFFISRKADTGMAPEMG